MTTFQQSRKEEMSEFFREPNREKLREILRGYDGEYDNLDFKQDWIDNAKLAKHILALANSGGGVIIFGVAEEEDNSLTVKGLEQLQDKADLAIDQYIPEEAQGIYEVPDYAYKSSEWEELEGKLFQVMFVDDVPEIIPLIAQKGAEGRIKKDAIYIRKNTKSIEASQSDIDSIINRRVREQLENESGDLRKDLAQLQTLYDFNYNNNPFSAASNLTQMLQPGNRQGFNDFINKKISEKESQIDKRLELQ